MLLQKYKKLVWFLVFIFLLEALSPIAKAGSSRIEELKSQINEKTQQIEELEKEIERYQKQIDEVLEQKKSLKNEIYRLNLNAKKLNTDIYLTEKRIEESELKIEKLGLEIEKKIKEIEQRKEMLGEVLRSINELESQTLVEITLAHDSLSDFFSDLERLNNIKESIVINLNELRILKSELEKQKSDEEEEKRRQEKLRSELVDKKALVERNKKIKTRLLQKTKNQEERYKKMLAEIKAKKEAFEREIRELEAQLRIEIDPNALPPAGSGVLAWPLDKVKITQYFGNTPFATKNPQVYNGMGHTGIDLRASIGTPVKAAASGVVEGIGNTDEIRGCYSYGKWILIRHYNGLSTLYAHLSLIKVKPGQKVTVGEVIGYSGQSGYATGPHLHFGVYATQGVRITKFTHSINCKNAVIPIADRKAYLNPLSYL